MKTILGRIEDLQDFPALLDRIHQNRLPLNLSLMQSARLPVLAALRQTIEKPIILITQKTDRAMALAEELPIWLGPEELFFIPEPSASFYENQPWAESTIRERVIALSRLTSSSIPGNHPPSFSPVFIAPARAVMTRTLPKREFIRNSKILKSGQQINLQATIKRLFFSGYQHAYSVTSPGQYARRGGILDVWPSQEDRPIRIELFGNEIDSIRVFSPGDQRTSIQRDRILLGPAREFILPPDALTEDNASEYSEFHIPKLHPDAGTVLDYLPDESLVLIDNLDAFQAILEEFERHALEARVELVKENNEDGDPALPYRTLSEILDKLSTMSVIYLGPSSSTPDLDLAYNFSSNPRFGGQLKPFFEYVDKTNLQEGDTVIISRQAARLRDVWNQTYPERGLSPSFLQGIITDGFSLSDSKQRDIRLHTDGEIFGWKRPQPRRPQRPTFKAPEADYAEFQLNDLVVHIDHGIGYFKGFVTREIAGVETEYFCVEYAGGDELYVPIHQSDRVSRYIGSRGHRPALSRLSGKEWTKITSRVKKAVEAVAKDLLELYAQRSVSQGYSFSPDANWQKELEASFPYIETEDQLKVLAEVKADMEKPIPMDRLICGDVGYGKTEIALRAAFKAVVDGKQVGILVPTTILAQQHFRTFRQRLAAFPVKVEMLSRFRTHSEQREIIQKLASGELDIVIGTHRLIQSDIEFHNLGLVIIDEEQRFGVQHKEHLKKLRTEVDVLTMTATPIPRTLYMTLTGIRDISTISTPPEERLPIQTHVGSYNPQLIRRAIVKEIERGGQIFFVHNRVQTIKSFGSKIARIVPEATIGIAHGQMAERDLEKVMRRFSRGEIDVLLSTSIIESGLDIPNANTLIVDRADTFGLAQLYQLRGRVGRGAQRAYAFFFKHPTRSSTEEGEMRLETLAENTQLGAGYSIAMRDLEIRGAGDFLGTRQHGQIAAVGLNLYTRLLSSAIKQIKEHGDLPTDSLPVAAATYHPVISIDLPLEISIPADYIPDDTLRLRLYRRVADAHSEEEIVKLEKEFSDRFGELPHPLENLFYQIRLRTLAEKVGVSSISAEGGQVAIRFPALPEGSPARKYPQMPIKINTGKNAIWYRYKETEDWQSILATCLRVLSGNST